MLSYPVCSILFGLSLIPLNVSQIRYIENTLYKFMIIGLILVACVFILIFANIKLKLKKGKT